MESTDRFVHDLVLRFPWLAEAYNEHLRDHSTLLPHVVMGDITRTVVTRAAASAELDSLQALMNHLDLALRTGSDEVKELIIVSFVENLIGERTALTNLRPIMGGKLRTAVERVCE